MDESKTLDGMLTSLEAYGQIFGAFNRHKNNDIARIRKKFGHSASIPDEKEK